MDDITKKQRNDIIGKMRGLCGRFLKMSDLERNIISTYDPYGSHRFGWRIKHHFDDCSYDSGEGEVSRIYVHVDMFDSLYTDVLCSVVADGDKAGSKVVRVIDVFMDGRSII